AALMNSSNARIASDLAAAYLVRATETNHAQDLPRALESATAALKTFPDMPEAAFNRALALERLALVDQTRQAWRDYLRLDSNSGWSNEAKSHLDVLTASNAPDLIVQERRELALTLANLKSDRDLIVVKSLRQTAREW